MKAIYEVKFLNKAAPATVTDSRRVCRAASTQGLQQAVKWAADVCGKDEFVGSVQLLASEQL